MSRRVVFEFEEGGKWPEGHVLTACGTNDVCLKSPKDLISIEGSKVVSALPAVPKNIPKDSRVRLSICNGAPCWDVRPPRETQAAWYSGGFSLLMFVVTVMVVRRLMNRWDGKK